MNGHGFDADRERGLEDADIPEALDVPSVDPAPPEPSDYPPADGGEGVDTMTPPER